MKKNHISEIDTFRAFAVLSVLLFHYFKNFYPGAPSFVLFGWTGVDLFFVISGFVMYLQLQRRYLKDGVIEYRKYFWNRFLRIAPAYYASLLAEIAFFHPEQFLSKSFFMHLTFTNIFSYQVAFSIQPIYWTLGVWAQFYLFLILFGKIFSGKKGYLSLSVIIAFSILYRYIVSTTFGFSNTGVLLINNLPGRFPEFCYGILMAKLYMKDDLWKRLNGNVWNALLLLVVGAVTYGFCARLWLSGGDKIFNDVFISTIFHPFVGLSFAMMMVVLMNLPEKMSFIMRLKPITFIGIISYSIYVWHIFILKILNDYLHIKEAGLRTGLMMTVSLVITIGFSYLSYYLIEKQFLKFKRK